MSGQPHAHQVATPKSIGRTSLATRHALSGNPARLGHFSRRHDTSSLRDQELRYAASCPFHGTDSSPAPGAWLPGVAASSFRENRVGNCLAEHFCVASDQNLPTPEDNAFAATSDPSQVSTTSFAILLDFPRKSKVGRRRGRATSYVSPPASCASPLSSAHASLTYCSGFKSSISKSSFRSSTSKDLERNFADR